MRATPKHQDNLAGKVIVLRRKSTHPPGRRLCWLSEDYHSCILIISPPATLSRLTKPSASSFDVPTLAYLQRNPHTPLLSYRFVFHPTARGVGEIKAARPCVDSVGGHASYNPPNHSSIPITKRATYWDYLRSELAAAIDSTMSEKHHTRPRCEWKRLEGGLLEYCPVSFICHASDC